MITPVLASSFVPDAVIIALTFFFGACVGSFLNVVIWRLPRRCLSLVKPGSHCPICKTPIKWHDNVPILGWLALRGKCRACKTSISFRYPAVEALTGALFALVVWLNVVAPPGAIDQWQSWALAGTHCVFISLMIAAAFIDADLTVIPDEINWGGTAAILLLALANPMHGGVSGVPANPAAAVNADLPTDIPRALPILGGDVRDFTSQGANVDPDNWTWLEVPCGPDGRGVRFAVSPLGDGSRRKLDVPAAMNRGEPVPGMPLFIKVSDRDVFRLEFHRGANAYVVVPVRPAVAPGSETAQVAKQWPVSGWFATAETDSPGGFTPHLRSFLGALFGALISGGAMWLLRATATGFLIKKALIHGRGAAMGMGDVKLLMLFGAMLGWAAALVSIFIGAALALLVTVPMLMMKKQHLFPFGPFPAMAAVVILLFHGRLMARMIEFYEPVFHAFR